MLTTALMLSCISVGVPAQTASSTSTDSTTEKPDELVMLSPFVVDVSKDKGYKATNATSGTRLDSAIRDLPLNLEVITADFIRDTGARDLREALRYSAGVVLESQSDAFVEVDGDPQGAGANDPRGATRRPGDSTIKMRGFVIDQVLRDGFRRQYSADAINIERVEVLRGPSALLYGVGSFGGVVNFIPKRPLAEPSYYFGATIGSNGLYRGEFDFTGPVAKNAWKFGYRLMGSIEEAGDQTDWYKQQHFTIDPVVSFNPFPNTTVVFDNEFGYSNQRGVGFQNLRANVNAAASRTASWLTDVSGGAIDTRTFRWSGPDTYLKGPFRNNVIDVTQKVADNLFVKVGAAQSRSVFDSRQIQDTGSNATPFAINVPTNYYPTSTVSIGGTKYNFRDALTQANADGTFEGLTPFQLYQNRDPGSFRGDRLYGYVVNDTIENQVNPGPPQTQDSAAIRYDWIDDNRVELRDQIRADVTYKLDLGKWGKHTFLAGTQYMKVKTDEERYGPPYSYANHAVADVDRYSYHNPGDYDYFRYGIQGDGLPDAPRTKLTHSQAFNWDFGLYGVYQGQFFKDRLTLIGGIRRDRNDQISTLYYDYEAGRDPLVSSRADISPNAPTATSPQLGINYRLNRYLSVFALYSTGVVPNYTATDGNGAPFPPTKAKNYEGGIKFDLLDGKLSGTVSAYQIKRTNLPKYLWWAPSPYQSKLAGYDPEKPATTVWSYPDAASVWYGIQKVGLDTAKKIFPSGFYPTLEAMANVPAGANEYTPAASFNSIPGVQRWWDWAIDPVTGKRGLMGQAEQNTYNSPSTADGIWFPLVNFSDPQQAAFAQAAKVDYVGWGGNWFYTPGQVYHFGDGSEGVGNAPTGSGASVPIDDQATGWDAQINYQPTRNLQVVLNYAHVNRKVTTNTYHFVSAPYWPFGWWYVKDGYFGTLSYTRTAAEAYGDVHDTTTYKAPIPEYAQSMDDTPANSASAWVHYDFADLVPKLKGFAVGFGGYWEDRRQWFTGFSGGGGNITGVDDGNGGRKLVQLWTPSRLTLNLLLEYRTKFFDKYNTGFAFNVDNHLDNQHRYGEIYAPGASYKFSVRVNF